MLGKLSRQTLAEQAAARLVELIQTESFGPGTLLPAEMRLATEFGVSRPIIREALRSLAGQGIIDIVNGKGAVVRPVGGELLSMYFQRAMQFRRATLVQLLEVRRGIEVQTARLAAQRRTADELAQMTEVVTTMRRILNDPDRYAGFDLQFHLLIGAATHNTMLYHLIESIRDASKDVIRTGLRYRQTLADKDTVQRQHEAILAGIRDGDVEATEQAMAHHLDDAVAALMVGRQENPAGAPP